MIKQIEFENKKQKILGIIHIPNISKSKKTQGILFLHGFTGNKIEAHRMFVKLACLLEQNGFFCLRFDFRGSGDSDGKFEDMTILEEVEDAHLALNFLKNYKGVNSSKIGVLGYSMAGCIASFLAGKNKMKSCVLWSSVSSLSKFLLHNLGKEFSKNIINKQYFDYNGTLINKNFFSQRIKPIENFKQFKGDLLIIHGSNDKVVSVREGKTYFSALKNRINALTQFYLIKDADHCYSNIFWQEELFKKTLNWFKKTL